jgi:zinc finger HIT domain-containing protein 3
VRAALTGQPRLQELLRSIDRLRGSAREEAIQDCLGVSRSEVRNSDNVSRGRMGGEIIVGEEEKEAMREFAEAIEGAVRGNRGDSLGLNWAQE